MKFMDYVKTHDFRVGALKRGHAVKRTKRVEGMLRAIEEGAVKQYHDKQDKVKCRRRFGKNGTRI